MELQKFHHLSLLFLLVLRSLPPKSAVKVSVSTKTITFGTHQPRTSHWHPFACDALSKCSRNVIWAPKATCVVLFLALLFWHRHQTYFCMFALVQHNPLTFGALIQLWKGTIYFRSDTKDKSQWNSSWSEEW